MYEDNVAIEKVEFSLDCDYHAHILPKVDDGAQSVEESLQLIHTAKAHGVNRIYATPHCYLHRTTVEKFCENRETAFRRLCEAQPELPIELGAEVLVFPGIDEMDGIERLTMGDTDMLLLEMPLSESLITENYYITVEELANRFQVVMAHANRYSNYVVRQMMEIGADLQINVDDLCRWTQRRRVEFWSEGNCSIALGSDIHRNAKNYKKFAKARKIMNRFY